MGELLVLEGGGALGTESPETGLGHIPQLNMFKFDKPFATNCQKIMAYNRIFYLDLCCFEPNISARSSVVRQTEDIVLLPCSNELVDHWP